ncbi:MAG: MASE1 domain-containing protein [Acidobacteria bacterium]|nr:MASE1 domain-containing protein [Acidobacteriota bacterium]
MRPRSLVDQTSRWLTGPSREAAVARNILVCVVYVLLAELVLWPRNDGGQAAMPAWPAHGWSLAVIWIFGRHVQYGLMAGATLVIVTHGPPLMAVLGCLGPVAGARAARRVLTHLRFDDRFERIRDPLLLTMVGAPVSALVSATIVTTAAGTAGLLPPPALAADWLLWVMRNWLGAATITPLVLAWRRARPLPDIISMARAAEAAVLITLLMVLASFVVWMWAITARDIPVAFLALPFITWSGLRFGMRGVSIVIVVLTSIAVFAAVFGLGPTVGLPMLVGQAMLFLFLLFTSTVGQVLAAMKAERDEAVARRVHLEEQLHHSQKMEAMGRLAGGMAHDFNNLLTTIVGYTEILMGAFDARDPKRADAEHVSRAAMRAAELARQLLTFSRRRGDAAKAVNANTVIDKVEPMLRRVIGADISLTIAPRSHQPVVSIDAGQLEQIVMHLVVNARDAMPRGGRLTVETLDVHLDEDTALDTPDAQPGDFVAIVVSDTGAGMPPLVRDRVFEPYFTTKEAGKGTGLGLSTVYGMVRQAHGHVTLTTAVGQGTTFRVLLPVAHVDAAPETEPMVSRLPRGTEHVLLLEDDASVRRLAKELLTKLGYSVIEAASGRAGLALGSDDARHFDIVVCDVILGDMSGPAVAEALQALRPGIRVLYISGYLDDVIVRTGVLGEGKPLLQKPFTPLQLARKIREVLEAREYDVA